MLDTLDMRLNDFEIPHWFVVYLEAIPYNSWRNILYAKHRANSFLAILTQINTLL